MDVDPGATICARMSIGSAPSRGTTPELCRRAAVEGDPGARLDRPRVRAERPNVPGRRGTAAEMRPGRPVEDELRGASFVLIKGGDPTDWSAIRPR
jgi:hypothetical protein